MTCLGEYCVLRLPEVELIDHAKRTEVPALSGPRRKLVISDKSRTKAINMYGDRLAYADRIGQLDKAAVGDASIDDCLGYIACHIGG